jgi:hypothetical protein
VPYIFVRAERAVVVTVDAAGLRQLWNDHVVLTRRFILAAEAGEPASVTTALGSLMKNQEALGAALGKPFGQKAMNAVAILLQEHITDLGAYTFARFAKDDEAAQAALILLGNNAKRISTALAALNPKWPADVVLKLLSEHLAHTKAEVDSRVLGDLVGDAGAYQAAVANAVMIADALAAGMPQSAPPSTVPAAS